MKITLQDINLDPANLSFAINDNSIDNTDPVPATHQDMNVPLYLNRTLIDAISQGASDIHFEPYADHFRIRMRIDGVMTQTADMPKVFGQQMSARIKVIAGLDISEHRIAQGGRFKLLLDNQKGLDFRCSTIPTLHGETIVLRLLYLPEDLLDLNLLGFETEHLPAIHNAIKQLQGMILVTGPTGSGKTVTLYTLIKHINQQPRSIYTVEDPVEIDLNGVNQISVDDRISFAESARTILRQDPDVIMLGEMRDSETIDTAIKAAHTGHLVLSTLHANTAAKSVQRLRNLGVQPHDIASTVSLVISQRLLRRLDPDNVEQIAVPKERLLALGFRADEIADLTLYRARVHNNSSGYKGRIGIYQVMPVTQALADLIAQGANDAQIATYAQQQGIQNLRRSALNKVKRGMTDIDEVERVLGLLEDYQPKDIKSLQAQTNPVITHLVKEVADESNA
jgi:type IV pilus assembly protein PilB